MYMYNAQIIYLVQFIPLQNLTIQCISVYSVNRVYIGQWSSVVSSLLLLTKVESPVGEVERFVGSHPQHGHLPGQRHVEDVLHAQPTVLWWSTPTIGDLGFCENTFRCVWGLFCRVPTPGLAIHLKILLIYTLCILLRMFV